MELFYLGMISQILPLKMFMNSHFHFLIFVKCAVMGQMYQCAQGLCWKIIIQQNKMGYIWHCKDFSCNVCDLGNLTVHPLYQACSMFDVVQAMQNLVCMQAISNSIHRMKSEYKYIYSFICVFVYISWVIKDIIIGQIYITNETQNLD